MAEYDEDSAREVREKLLQLNRDHPEVGVLSKLAGNLIGPASPGRPDFPVWQYREVGEDPESDWTLVELHSVRFPFHTWSGEWATVSVIEISQTWRVEPDVVTEFYRKCADAGHLSWDQESRGLRELSDPAQYAVPVFKSLT